MLSERQLLMRYFTRLDLGQGELSFDKLLLDAIEKSLSKKGALRDAYFDANVKRIWNYICKQQDDDFLYQKIEPLFEIKNLLSRTIVCNLSKKYNQSQKKFFDKLKTRSFLLKEIDLINSRPYEALSILLCQSLDANNFFLTPPGNEAGIDFVATIKFSEKLHYLLGVNGPIKIIGQCKKYSTHVQVDKIKEFNATLNDVYHVTPKIKNVLPTWFFQTRGLIVGWVIAHSGFQQGARDRAKDFGIMLSESRDIAEVLAKSQNFYYNEDYDKRHHKLTDELDRILKM